MALQSLALAIGALLTIPAGARAFTFLAGNLPDTLYAAESPP